MSEISDKKNHILNEIDRCFDLCINNKREEKKRI